MNEDNSEFGIRNSEFEERTDDSEVGVRSSEFEERIAAAPAEPRNDRSGDDSEVGIRSSESGEREDEQRSERAFEPVEEARRCGACEDELRAHYASLRAQAAALAAELPDFDLDAALRDGDFVRLTSPAVGVSVRGAWYALHGAEREALAVRRALDEAADAVARSAARPREGGRGLAAGSLSALDSRALDRAQRDALRRRIYDAAARGEKIYP